MATSNATLFDKILHEQLPDYCPECSNPAVLPWRTWRRSGETMYSYRCVRCKLVWWVQ